MVEDDFEWDDAKAADNQAKHGVSFDFAKGVFRDPLAIEFIDDRDPYDEERDSSSLAWLKGFFCSSPMPSAMSAVG